MEMVKTGLDKVPREAKVHRFEDAARAFECDESEERFDAALRKIAAHKPPKDSERGAPQAAAKPSKETR
jgi:hypothetical protein